MMEPVCMLYVTCANTEEALRIAELAVEERLAACANLLGAIESVYRWEGKIEHGCETALLLKTTESCADALTARIKELHSYECPCVVRTDVAGGNQDFLKWIADEVRP